ncbi:hypothetical protein AB4Y63_02555 [Leifsonia sp. YAF41]|uniref:hypothetical protein n=1 Tax=Leifsonia sp. YAF41 TaxID=3233086 RepID=UPI003F9760A9
MTRFGESNRRDDDYDDGDGWATDSRPPRNPFLTALWVIGVALIVGGMWMVWQAIAAQNRGYSGISGEAPIELILQQLTWSLAPSMTSTGMLVLVGLVFERAIRWQRERRAAS